MHTSDALILGGGHNGLVCAAYLAAAGMTVTVLERRAVHGGAAVTEEFHPGFRNSTASYTVSLLNPQIAADLRLAKHGLRVVERPYANFLPNFDGGAFRLGGNVGMDDLVRLSPRDAQRLPDYYAMLDRDDTFLHEAWNHSDKTRVILLLDSWNPHMTEVEQLAVAELVAAIGDFSKETNTSIPGDSDATDAPSTNAPAAG